LKEWFTKIMIQSVLTLKTRVLKKNQRTRSEDLSCVVGYLPVPFAKPHGSLKIFKTWRFFGFWKSSTTETNRLLTKSKNRTILVFTCCLISPKWQNFAAFGPVCWARQDDGSLPWYMPCFSSLYVLVASY